MGYVLQEHDDRELERAGRESEKDDREQGLDGMQQGLDDKEHESDGMEKELDGKEEGIDDKKQDLGDVELHNLELEYIRILHLKEDKDRMRESMQENGVENRDAEQECIHICEDLADEQVFVDLVLEHTGEVGEEVYMEKNGMEQEDQVCKEEKEEFHQEPRDCH